uniref:Ribonuclease H-like domain-containing protein n=1 Tax=Tanacetum cinerariifolium TaxID=118510 RepID=A0A699IUB6_TANCI|nr:ribonuclease H-like domain-containing protein [Tanacetum cinerariifolium]
MDLLYSSLEAATYPIQLDSYSLPSRDMPGTNRENNQFILAVVEERSDIILRFGPRDDTSSFEELLPRLGHPGDDVLRRLESRNLISCRKSKLSALCHACQLGIRPVLLQTDASNNMIIAYLHNEFAMKDLGSLNYYLGISAQRSASGLFFCQLKFAEEILERAHMQNCNSCRTPVDTESKLDLSYVVQHICLYMHEPRDPHFTALKRILCYARGTLDYGLHLHVSLIAGFPPLFKLNFFKKEKASKKEQKALESIKPVQHEAIPSRFPNEA